MAGVIGAKPPKMQLSCIFGILWGSLGTLMGYVSGITPALTYNMALAGCDEHYFTSEKACKALNLPQTPVEIAIYESFNWLKTHGYLD